MSLQLLRPEFLLFFLLLPFVVWLGLSSGRMSRRRRRAATLLRCSILALLILALSRPRLLRPADERSAGFLLDLSDSVPAGERLRGEEFARAAALLTGPEDSLALVVFGDRALVERSARAGPLEDLHSRPGGGRSDIAAALRLGAAALPSDSSRRLVLVSDGRHNRGELDPQVEMIEAQGIPVDVLPLAAAASPDEALIAALEAPASTRVGQRFDLEAVIRSKRAQRARLQILREGASIYDEALALRAGEQRIRVPLRVEEAGPVRYRALLSPTVDGRSENNAATAFTIGAGPPRVLVIEGEEGRAAPLISALDAADREAERVSPEAAPNSLLALSGYEAVVLVDVPARRLSRGSMEAIVAAVRDQGRGLLMVGGEDSFGAGGYRHTPLEKALPVDMEVRDRETRPNLAIAFVLDRSGSMGSGGMLGGQTVSKLDLAKEAVLQSSGLIRARDRVHVQAFDDQAYEIWPLRPHERPGDFEEAVAGIQVGGGTNIYAGLEAATAVLERAEDVPLKHVILLSDGWSEASGYDRVLARMQAAGITLSIVAIGQDSAPYLAELAGAGGGRFYPVADPGDVPRVFVEETITTLGSYVIEERFLPLPGAPSQILSGLDLEALPPLNGYNPTTAKQSATVALWSPHEDPVLAQWQYGLGRAVAWTSDLKRQWGSDWLEWADFGGFATQLIDWSLPPPEAPGFEVSVKVEAGEASLALEASGEEGRALNRLEVRARVSPPGGEGFDVALTQSASGRYAAGFDLSEEGVYLARIDARDEAGAQVGGRTAGFVVPYSPEYADPADAPIDPRLYRLAEQSGGRVIQEPARAFDRVEEIEKASEVWRFFLLAAALLFPLDVGLRKLRLGPADLAALGGRLRQGRQGRREERRARPREKALGTLFEAKQRAAGAAARPPSGRAATPEGAERATADAARAAGNAGGESESGEGAPAPARPAERPEGGSEPPASFEDEDRLSRLREAKRRAKRR